MSAAVSVTFRGFTVDLPAGWSHDEGENALFAAPPDEGPFLANVVVQVVDGAADPVAGLHRLAGSVVLARGRSTGAVPAEQLLFGYPLPVAAVTAVQLIGDPTLEGRLVVTYSADATRFADQWPAVQDVLRSIRRTS